MVPALATLLVFQVLGEALVRVLAAPVPGAMPVAGRSPIHGILGGACVAVARVRWLRRYANAASMSFASFSGASCGA